ncbi:MAG: hypothetical protein CME70_16030 [Halobacteriovorax sp.]|nr:hypothetical protein [Halobacteriovorax sp.]|tara:strand:+ start:69574 stop:69852 length:279 start_codon:yes stop_codon:yes gene_type:complete
MKSIIGVFAFVVFTSPSFAYMENVNKIDLKEKKALKTMTVDKASLVMFEQYMSKKKKYNGKDSYAMNFICKKVNKDTKCNLVEYEILKKETR